ncbi:hypothetical protein BKA70DRAFT_1236280 [Coprinopsis sp. MPI-PUGE-AT-0042]|nr:hypothetical protein BKA70DRAFT_1236280 [Coprinopsis sp. MPI-PUGE-AT-0042]
MRPSCVRLSARLRSPLIHELWQHCVGVKTPPGDSQNAHLKTSSPSGVLRNYQRLLNLTLGAGKRRCALGVASGYLALAFERFVGGMKGPELSDRFPGKDASNCGGEALQIAFWPELLFEVTDNAIYQLNGEEREDISKKNGLRP